MPSKKKKYNARFPAGRIKKIMQSDEEVGKVAQAVPIIISRTLELFVESLLTKTLRITNSRNAKTLSPSHMKQCIMSENRFDFLRELVKNIPDISVADEAANNENICLSPGPTSTSTSSSSSLIDNSMPQPYDLSINKPSTSSNNNDGSNFSTIISRTSTNGNTAAEISIGNGGGISINIKPPCTTVGAVAASLPTAVSTNSNMEMRAELKRQWDNVHACRKQHLDKNSAAASQKECTPAKLSRMDSLPNANYEKNSMRRLQHQSKSVPCSSKEAAYQLPPPVVPAPIISTENICDKPIVKIDYSNLALHDNDLLTSSPLSLSTSKSSKNENTSIKNDIKPTVNITTNPVINIDLSNISSSSSPSAALSLSTVSSSSSSSSSKTSTETVRGTVISPVAIKSTIKINSQSSNNLELDEDYDNI